MGNYLTHQHSGTCSTTRSGAYSLQPAPNPICFGHRRQGKGNRTYVRACSFARPRIYPVGAAFIPRPNLLPPPSSFTLALERCWQSMGIGEEAQGVQKDDTFTV
ncbi:hypothetical protein PVAP13_3KG069227 [Panicum virgatum]|uniref:Uncharacterized protein n=1 Tax=Panicum virgatum TaxID=38727 RepID=A0A8T0UTP3_PANVG|nr:hypothetical protein PVAP13_3KG069227 [Panicum virgatum]